MNILATILNVVLFLFTCLILWTDGLSGEAVYLLLTLLLLLVPILNLLMISTGAKSNGWFNTVVKRREPEDQGKVENLSFTGTIMKALVVTSNIILLGFSLWAFISQYPHPRESGFIAFIILLLLTPVLSSFAIIRNRANLSR